MNNLSAAGLIRRKCDGARPDHGELHAGAARYHRHFVSDHALRRILPRRGKG
ncbi:MAG: hypothetical protein ABIQ36_12170 [Rhodanobacter sp.]